MGHEAQDLDDFKKEVRDDLKILTNNVGELTKAVSTMATTLAVSEEQKKHQDEKNRRAENAINRLDDRVSAIELARAKEERGRQFINKWWPYMLVSAVLISAVVTSFFGGLGRNMTNFLG